MTIKKLLFYLEGVRKDCLFIFLMAAAVATFAAGCGKKDDAAGKKTPGPVPVAVVKAESRNIPWIFDTYGTVEAFASVDVNSLVGGQIVKVEFVAGQKVRKGDVLIRIDSRQFEANVKQLEASLDRNILLCADAERQAKVKEELHSKNAVSGDEMLKTRVVFEALKRMIRVDQANLDRAKLDVEYCTIKAPFDGRVGDILQDEGSIIKANDDNLVNITATVPAYVAFALPERLLPVVQKLMAGGKKVEVTAKIDTGKEKIQRRGELCFVDNNVNQNSGTVMIKALFPNTDEILWPGLFVEVSLELSAGELFTAIPSEAVQNGQLGMQIFVVKADSSVELRPVEIERSAEGLSAIAKGVEPGETVVLTGQFRLVPGAKVSIVAGDPVKKAIATPDKK
ncbi:MAG: hypothetical protein A2X48_22310 [Lentisphaerae bacterium GWF2_49_21]|nr:MAG: hypothetical protein A2X48_22310 [Lentisphaerae bacterium GWF2_49_21]